MSTIYTEFLTPLGTVKIGTRNRFFEVPLINDKGVFFFKSMKLSTGFFFETRKSYDLLKIYSGTKNTKIKGDFVA